MASSHRKDFKSWNLLLVCFLSLVIPMAHSAVASNNSNKNSKLLVLPENGNSFEVISSPLLSYLVELCKSDEGTKEPIPIKFRWNTKGYYLCNPIYYDLGYLEKDNLYDYPFAILRSIYYLALPFINLPYEKDRESSFSLKLTCNNTQTIEAIKTIEKIGLFVLKSIFIWTYKKLMLYYHDSGIAPNTSDNNTNAIIKKGKEVLKIIWILHPIIRECKGGVKTINDVFTKNEIIVRDKIRCNKFLFFRKLGLKDADNLDMYISNFEKTNSNKLVGEQRESYEELIKKYLTLQNDIWNMSGKFASDNSGYLVPFFKGKDKKKDLEEMQEIKTSFSVFHKKVNAFPNNELAEKIQNIIDNLETLIKVASKEKQCKFYNLLCSKTHETGIITRISTKFTQTLLEVEKEICGIKWVPGLLCDNYIWETAKMVEAEHKMPKTSRPILNYITGIDGENYFNSFLKKYYSAFPGLIKSIGDLKIFEELEYTHKNVVCCCRWMIERRLVSIQILLLKKAIDKVLSQEWKIESWVNLYIEVKLGMLEQKYLNNHISFILKELRVSGVTSICDIINTQNPRLIKLMYALNILGYNYHSYKAWEIKIDSTSKSKNKSSHSCLATISDEDYSMKFRALMYFETTLKDKISTCN